MKKNIAAVSVGSNINPDENISKARQFLSEDHTLLAASDFVTTRPVGDEDQPDFTNGAFLIETNLNFEDFNAHLKTLENRCGRKSSANKFAPRTLDLDVIVWNDEIVDLDFHQRDFLQKTINQILPHIESKPV